MASDLASPRRDGDTQTLFVVARFHAREGQEEAVAAALRDQRRLVPDEFGCLEFEALRSRRDPRLFYLTSRWADEAAFDIHAELPNTARFLERIQPLIDHELDVTRARPL